MSKIGEFTVAHKSPCELNHHCKSYDTCKERHLCISINSSQREIVSLKTVNVVRSQIYASFHHNTTQLDKRIHRRFYEQVNDGTVTL